MHHTAVIMLGSGKHYKDAKALWLDVAAMFSAAGRSFHSGKGGGRLKKYICNGAAAGCQATVRVCRQRSGEFKVTLFIPEHNDCSGGKVGAEAAALEGFASAAMVSNPTMKGTDLKRSLEQSTGLRVSYSTASRLKVVATRASKEQLENGYRIMDSYCTCGFPARFQIPCCEVIAVARGGKILCFRGGQDGRCHDPDAPGLSPQYHRQTYADDAYQVMLPVPSTLEEDDTLLPPLPVDGQAGAPKKLGPKKFKRIAGRGDKYASSSFNTRVSELGPAASGTTAAPSLSQGGATAAPSSLQGGRAGGSVTVGGMVIILTR
ncbi:unnamed protein product [Ectocarpus sp. CCAP 1310/34]|nr:unnamed protein product [Ectocarpus sp. CCAP 1310/34]